MESRFGSVYIDVLVVVGMLAMYSLIPVGYWLLFRAYSRICMYKDAGLPLTDRQKWLYDLITQTPD